MPSGLLARCLHDELRHWGNHQIAGETLLDWCQRHLPEHCDREFSGLHNWLSAELDRARDVRGCKIGLVGPRGSAKSTIATLGAVLRGLCEGAERYIWIISDTKTQAETHLDNVRRELLENKSLIERYGGRAIGRRGTWSTASIHLGNGCFLEAYGTGQKLRGRRRGSARPTLIVCDDLQNDNHILSVVQRDATARWFSSTVLPAGRPSTNIVVLGTALHRDCLAIQMLTAPGWRSRQFSAIEAWPARMDLWAAWEELYCDETLEDQMASAWKFYESQREEMHRGSKVLWPTEEPLYRLMCSRAEGGHAAFEREKQSNPVDPDRSEWPSTYFSDVIWVDSFPELLVSVIAVDPATGKDPKRGDFTAMVMVGIANDGLLYVDARLSKEPLPVWSLQAAELVRQWRPMWLVVESNQFQQLVGEELEKRLTASLSDPVQISLMDNKVPKGLRLRRLGPHLAQRRLRFLRSCPSCQLVVEQLRDFPLAGWDDGPDALEMAIRMLSEQLERSGLSGPLATSGRIAS